MDILESLKRLMLAGIGVPEKLKEVVDDLVKKGELSESQAKKVFTEWSERAEKGSEDLGKVVSDAVKKALDKMHIPTKDELDSLRGEVKALSKKLDGLKK